VTLLLAALALGATALAAAAALRLRSLVSFGLAAYLIAWAGLVLLTEALSPLRLVGAGGYLAGHLVLLVAAAGAWQLAGRPLPPLPRLDLRAATRDHPIVAVLAVVLLAGVCYAVFLGLATPPNNGDAMSYRLSRAVAWLQHGGIHWIPDVHTERENEFPWVSEISILWTFAFVGRDTAAALPQLAALGAVVLAVFGSARRLGYGRAASAFAGLLTATLTEVALQTVQTQNDLVVASFVAAAAYFVRGADRAELGLAGLAAALAVGTKFTAFLALPVLALLAAVSLPRRRLALAAGAAAVTFALVTAPMYVRNLARTGGALGEAAEQEVYRPDVTVSGTASTVGRALYRFADLSGFRVRTSWLEPVADVGEAVFDTLHLRPDAPESAGSPFTYEVNVVAHEDHSFYGPLGLLLVLPLVVVFLLAWPLRRVSAAHAAHALALPLYLLAFALVFRFTDEGRYLMAPVVLTMPLAASVYRYRALAAGAALLGAATLFFAHAYNELKPTGLAGTTPAWELPRPLAQGIGTPGIGAMIAGLDARVPSDARLGVVLAENARDYPLYGPELDRELVALPNPGVLEAADNERLDWVFLGIEQRVPPLEGRWERIPLARTATLLRRLKPPPPGSG
jgi:Glycosyltransferase family 87